MPTNLPDLDSYPDLTFPEAGLDLAAEFETQAPLTTPVGLNVRGYEPLSGRARGGSRPGLSRYIATTVAGAHLIQHLNVVVDPHPRGLPAFGGGGGGGGGPGGTGDGVDLGGGLVPDPHEGEAPDVPDTGTTTDPSTNNNSDRNNGDRDPRAGGTGNQPNRHLPPPPPPPPPIAFVQSVYAPVPGSYTPGFSTFGFTGGNARRTVTLPGHVADGNLLVALVAAVNSEVLPGTPTNLQVRNANLSAYTRAGSIPLYAHSGGHFELSLWFRVATGGTFEDAVLVDPDVSCGLSVAVLEFTHVLAPSTASLDGFSSHTAGGTFPFPSSATTGSVGVGLAGDCLVAGWSDDAQDVSAAGGVPAGYVLAVDQHDGTDMPSLFVAYKLGLSASEAAVLTYAVNFSYNAAGASFKQS